MDGGGIAGHVPTHADSRHAAGMALKEFPKASNTAIAEMCLVGHELVAEIRKTQPYDSVGLRPPPVRRGRIGRMHLLRPPATFSPARRRARRAGQRDAGLWEEGREKKPHGERRWEPGNRIIGTREEEGMEARGTFDCGFVQPWNANNEGGRFTPMPKSRQPSPPPRSLHSFQELGGTLRSIQESKNHTHK